MIIYVNGEGRDIEDNARLIDVLDTASIEDGEPRRGVAIALDGSVVARGAVASTPLSEGARVEIVTAVQGG